MTAIRRRVVWQMVIKNCPSKTSRLRCKLDCGHEVTRVYNGGRRKAYAYCGYCDPERKVG